MAPSRLSARVNSCTTRTCAVSSTFLRRSVYSRTVAFSRVVRTGACRDQMTFQSSTSSTGSSLDVDEMLLLLRDRLLGRDNDEEELRRLFLVSPPPAEEMCSSSTLSSDLPTKLRSGSKQVIVPLFPTTVTTSGKRPLSSWWDAEGSSNDLRVESASSSWSHAISVRLF